MNRRPKTIKSAKAASLKRPALTMSKGAAFISQTQTVLAPKVTSSSYARGLGIVDGIVQSWQFTEPEVVVSKREEKVQAFRVPKMQTEKVVVRTQRFRWLRNFAHTFRLTALTLAIILLSIPAISAFEAHLLGVTATLVSIDMPTLTTSINRGLIVATQINMTDPDPDATHIYYTFSQSTINPDELADPVCGQTSPGGGGGVKQQSILIAKSTVIKAVACDGDSSSAHKSSVNAQVYLFEAPQSAEAVEPTENVEGTEDEDTTPTEPALEEPSDDDPSDAQPTEAPAPEEPQIVDEGGAVMPDDSTETNQVEESSDAPDEAPAEETPAPEEQSAPEASEEEVVAPKEADPILEVTVSEPGTGSDAPPSSNADAPAAE